MLPYNGNTDDFVLDFDNDEQEKTKTFKINTTTNLMGNMIDGKSALQQSIYLMLSIEADQYIIYPYTYAMKTIDLIGKPIYYVIAVLPDRIKETLLSDDRILDVSDFEFTYKSKTVHVKFVVSSIYGDIEMETEVGY